MSKKSKKRFFLKRNDEVKDTEVASVSEPKVADLPHNPRLIPAEDVASIWYKGFVMALYASILFCVSTVILFTSWKPSVTSGEAYALIHSPASAESHLQYLDWLVKHYRLADAEREIVYLENAQKKDWYSDISLSRLAGLQATTVTHRQYFRALVAEYAYWLGTLKMYPNYRDGMYRMSQLSFMLYNDIEAQELLNRGVELDPYFNEGRDVSRQLETGEDK